MDIVLHAGAHRTGTTTFQSYMRGQAADLVRGSVAFWGPRRTRTTIFPGIFPGPRAAVGRDPVRRAAGRIAMLTGGLRATGCEVLLVSDENMIGTPQHCLRHAALYPAAGERMARIAAAFGGQIGRVVLTVRAQDLFWASLAAYAVGRGHGVPDRERLERIACGQRSWRDVITDIACAMPGARIEVLPFEQIAGRPDALLACATGHDAPRPSQALWLNRALDCAALRARLIEAGRDAEALPDARGRWQPFSREQAARLAETYADDMHWLTAGADGLATLVRDDTDDRAGQTPPMQDRTEGQGHDIRQGQVARPG